MWILVLRLVHFLAMGLWFGASLLSTGDVRRTIKAGGDTTLLNERMKRMTRVVGPSALLTIVSGVLMIFAMGGFAAVRPAIHIGLVLTIVMWVVGGGGMGLKWRQIQKAMEEGKDAAALAPHLKKMSMMAGIFQLLWLVTLLLMIFRNVIL
jgi:hypothetical protein